MGENSKLHIKASIGDNPFEADFDIEIPQEYGKVASRSAKVFSIVANAVQKIREEIEDDRD